MKRKTKVEHSSVSDELLFNVSDIEIKCSAIDKAVSENYFSFEEALKHYNVSKNEYINFKNNKK